MYIYKRSYYICVIYYVHKRPPCHVMPNKHHTIKMKRKESFIASINICPTRSTHQSNITMPILLIIARQ